MPTRSRIVFLYSLRLSRRMVTRPGSLFLVQSAAARPSSTQLWMICCSFALGFGLPSGGMSPVRKLWATFSQTCGFLSAAFSSLNLSSANSPLGRGPPWHLMQYLVRIGTTSLAKASGGFLSAFWAAAISGNDPMARQGLSVPKGRKRERIEKLRKGLGGIEVGPGVLSILSNYSGGLELNQNNPYIHTFVVSRLFLIGRQRFFRSSTP